ncbi:MAG: peptidoglycan-binding protein [Actinomycetota bacterium]|nr:peptidoglycan-binding protein [Actinomycetota bacterium]
MIADHGANARRLGIMYVIHNKKIWAVYREKDGWRASSGHTDHIHVSFSWNGARADTSFWTGEVQPVDYGPCARLAGQHAVLRSWANTSRCYTPSALVKKNKNTVQMYGSRAASVKTAQGLLKVSKTGVFDSATWAAVKAFQEKRDLPWTGALDVPTWGALKPADVTSDVAKGYSPGSAAAYGLANYAGSTISKYATGKPVLSCRLRLRCRPRIATATSAR